MILLSIGAYYFFPKSAEKSAESETEPTRRIFWESLGEDLPPVPYTLATRNALAECLISENDPPFDELTVEEEGEALAYFHDYLSVRKLLIQRIRPSNTGNHIDYGTDTFPPWVTAFACARRRCKDASDPALLEGLQELTDVIAQHNRAAAEQLGPIIETLRNSGSFQGLPLRAFFKGPPGRINYEISVQGVGELRIQATGEVSSRHSRSGRDGASWRPGD